MIKYFIATKDNYEDETTWEMHDDFIKPNTKRIPASFRQYPALFAKTTQEHNLTCCVNVLWI